MPASVHKIVNTARTSARATSARQAVRRAIPQVRDIHGAQHCFHALANLRRGPAELQRTECQIVEHAGGEQLRVRILKHKAHAAAETIEEFLVLAGDR